MISVHEAFAVEKLCSKFKTVGATHLEAKHMQPSVIAEEMEFEVSIRS